MGHKVLETLAVFSLAIILMMCVWWTLGFQLLSVQTKPADIQQLPSKVEQIESKCR